MSNDRRIIDLVEDALDAHPACTVCGGPFDVVARDDQLWLDCRALDGARTLRRRLVDAILGHDRIAVATLPAASAPSAAA